MSEPRKAVVLLSGGLDSTTTLAIARAQGFECHTVSFDYGQRHTAELSAGMDIAKAHGSAEHRIMRIGLGGLGGSALTDRAIDVPDEPAEGIPVTYVPARNTVFLSVALGYAEVIGSFDIFIGVNAVDYSGYPDCRPEFVEAFENLANLATKAAVEGSGRFSVHAPLLHWTKAEIIRRGAELGVDYAHTVSCYRADQEGRACGRCDACRFRAQGFREAGVEDPTRYQPGVTPP